MGHEVLKKVGRYFLLDCIAQGGMAEIFRARPVSKDAGGRLLVIKRILTGQGANDEFRKMFQSEIKVMMGFSHPNIVQLYDFGDENGHPYIAMELVEGKNLRQFITRFSEKRMEFPIEVSVYIIEQVATGLHYAHVFKDRISGKPLHIVHRDVSPQNVLVSFDGNVKIIDFGIAKANTNSESTRVGIIKGKPSYLSPEQVAGKTLDGRSDVFALGIVLWESLTGRKLFANTGENEFAVLKLIETCHKHVKPPSKFNPKVPAELDEIVMKSLTRNRDDRYQDAEALQRALRKFLYQYKPDFNPGDLAYVARDLFKESIVEDKKRLRALNASAERLLSQPESKIPTEGGPPAEDSRPGEDTNTTAFTRGKSSVGDDSGSRNDIDIGALGNDQVEIEDFSMAWKKTANGGEPIIKRSPPNQSNDAGGIKAKGPPTAGAPGAKKVAPSMNRPRSGPANQSRPNARPAGGRGPRRPSGPGRRQDPRMEVDNGGGFKKIAAMVIIFAGVGYVAMTNPKKIPPLCRILDSCQVDGREPDSETSPEVSPDKKLELSFNLSPGYGETVISINGKLLDPVKPVVWLSLDKSHELIVNREGYKPFSRVFVLSKEEYGRQMSTKMNIELEPIRYGYLTLMTHPSSMATIQRLGQGRSVAAAWQMEVPFVNRKVPVGRYEIKLDNQDVRMGHTLVIDVEEGKSVKKDVKLQPYR